MERNSQKALHPVVIGIILSFLVVITVNGIMIVLAVKSSTPKTTETAYEDAQAFNEIQSANMAFNKRFTFESCVLFDKRSLICSIIPKQSSEPILEAIDTISVKLSRPNDISADQSLTLTASHSDDSTHQSQIGYKFKVELGEKNSIPSGMFFADLYFNLDGRLHLWHGKIWLS